MSVHGICACSGGGVSAALTGATTAGLRTECVVSACGAQAQARAPARLQYRPTAPGPGYRDKVLQGNNGSTGCDYFTSASPGFTCAFQPNERTICYIHLAILALIAFL